MVTVWVLGSDKAGFYHPQTQVRVQVKDSQSTLGIKPLSLSLIIKRKFRGSSNCQTILFL